MPIQRTPAPPELIPAGTPPSVKVFMEARVPEFDPTVGQPLPRRTGARPSIAW